MRDYPLDWNFADNAVLCIISCVNDSFVCVLCVDLFFSPFVSSSVTSHTMWN